MHFSGLKKPLRQCIIVDIPGTGKVKTSIQYQTLPAFCFFCGQIGHIFSRCDALKNSPNGSRWSQENWPYPESLGISEKAQSDISFHKKLYSSVALGTLSTVDSGFKSSSSTSIHTASPCTPSSEILSILENQAIPIKLL